MYSALEADFSALMRYINSRFTSLYLLRRLKSDWREALNNGSSIKYASTDGVGFFDLTSYFQDSGHDVISHGKREKCCRLMIAYAVSFAGCPLTTLSTLPAVHGAFVLQGFL